MRLLMCLCLALMITAPASFADGQANYKMTVTRACTTPEHEDCSKLDEAFTFEFIVYDRGNDALLKLDGEEPVYMLVSDADYDALKLIYTGESDSGVTHSITYSATGAFDYSLDRQDGQARFYHGFLERIR